MAGGRLIELALASVLLSGVWTKHRMVLVGLGICLTELLRGMYWSGVAVWLAPWAVLGSAIMIGMLELAVQRFAPVLRNPDHMELALLPGVGSAAAVVHGSLLGLREH